MDPSRPTPLLVHEWITAMCLREELEYDLPDDAVPYRVRSSHTDPEVLSNLDPENHLESPDRNEG